MANRNKGQRKAKPKSARSVSKAKNGKTLAIFVSLTKAERTKLERIGKASDIGLGKVMRAALLRCPLKVKAPAEKVEAANRHYGKAGKKKATAAKPKKKAAPKKVSKPRPKKAPKPPAPPPMPPPDDEDDIDA